MTENRLPQRSGERFCRTAGPHPCGFAAEQTGIGPIFHSASEDVFFGRIFMVPAGYTFKRRFCA